jgi:hypothetical protein
MMLASPSRIPVDVRKYMSRREKKKVRPESAGNALRRGV